MTTTAQASDTYFPARPSTDEAVRDLDHAHVFHSWSAQEEINPLPVASGSGASFTDYEGREFLDFGSQLVYVNLGHSHPRLVQAIKDQADVLPTIAPGFANDARAQLAAMIAQVAPGNLNHVFFTNGGADANENAVRMARAFTGRPKVMSAYRSYHGATSTAISLTGDPRRWSNEPGDGSVVHFFGPYLYRSMWQAETAEEETAAALHSLEQQIILEGAGTIAAIILESVVGTNGILVPPPGFLAGVRELCTKYGILYIADEVMAGFGRTGQWFAVNNWDIEPDLITFAKGVNSGYVPLGGVVISDEIREFYAHRSFGGGLTYSGHPLACAVAVESMKTFVDEGILERTRDLGERVVKPRLEAMKEKHAVVGDVRGLGLFWAIELVKDGETREPLVPFNAAGADNAPMAEFTKLCQAGGVWPWTHFNGVHVGPPLVISEEDLVHGLEVIDRALGELDRYAQ
ncbi:MAG: aspartate aminotransferase family protein [Corynebacterium variabile]|uniref:aspartate aminotransferase family protein n=1 Tax=Corynebacterium variabile TaxID=1727 RepID=UPI003F93D379